MVMKLRATMRSMTDATLVDGPTLNGLSLAVEKPGSFIVEYNVPKKDVRLQFMNTVWIAEKPLNLTFTHSRAESDNRTIVDGSLLFDSANKLSANVGAENCKIKYTYAHEGLATFEPCYDLAKETWDFAVSRKFYSGDTVKATYDTSSKLLGMEWSKNTEASGFKVCASVNLEDEGKTPELTAVTTWNLEI